MNRVGRRTITEVLALGTAQFGMPYGLANRQGKPDAARVREILDAAHEAGLRVLDTAAAYGDCEAVLGACGTDRWQITTKFPSLFGIDEPNVGDKARDWVLRSLDLMRTGTVHAVLAHDRRDMMGDRGRRIRDALAPLRAEGVIGRIGVSVYGPHDLQGIEAENAQIVQAPFNVLDQRIVASGAGRRLRAAGGVLHVRSLFLQGLLPMPVSERPVRFARWRPVLARFDARVRDSGLSAAAFCLGFAAAQTDVARCVIGVDTVTQLCELLRAFDAAQQARIEAHDLAEGHPDLIDPRRWKGAA